MCETRQRPLYSQPLVLFNTYSYIDADNPEWQDPSLLADIEAQTGINLKVERSKKPGKFKSKLTNIKKVNNTSRSRLESKVLSR